MFHCFHWSYSLECISFIYYFQGFRCLASGETLKLLALFHIFHIIFFLAVSSALIGIYVVIGRKIYMHTHFRESVQAGSERFPEESPQVQPKNTNRPSPISHATLKRTTGTLFTVTLAYIVSAIPHHVLSVIFFVNPSFDCSMTLLGGQFYYTFIWSYFINSAINPFIYSFRDSKFRHEVKTMYGLVMWHKCELICFYNYWCHKCIVKFRKTCVTFLSVYLTYQILHHISVFNQQ